MKRKYKYVYIFDKEKYLNYLKKNYSPSDYMIERELSEEFYIHCDQKRIDYLVSEGYKDIKKEWCKRKRQYLE